MLIWGGTKPVLRLCLPEARYSAPERSREEQGSRVLWCYE